MGNCDITTLKNRENKVYSELGISKTVNNYDKEFKNKYKLDEILRLLVFTRILYLGSKLENSKIQNKLLGNCNIEYNHIMRFLSKLNSLKYDIQIQMHNTISDSIGREATLVFYDVTNYYFDTDFNDEDILDDEGNIVYEALRKRGPSKEKKPIAQM